MQGAGRIDTILGIGPEVRAFSQRFKGGKGSDLFRPFQFPDAKRKHFEQTEKVAPKLRAAA